MEEFANLLYQFDTNGNKLIDTSKTADRTARWLKDLMLIEIQYAESLQILNDKNTSQAIQFQEDPANIMSQGVKVYYKQKCNQLYIIEQAMGPEITELLNMIRKNDTTLQQYIKQRKIIENELIQNYDKYDKNKEKYYRLSKEYDENSLIFEILTNDSNNTDNSEKLKKLVNRIKQLYNDRKECEKQYMLSIRNNNMSIDSKREEIHNMNQKIISMQQEIFQKFKDLISKLMVNEISLIRNAQYDADLIIQQFDDLQAGKPAETIVPYQFYQNYNKEAFINQDANFYKSCLQTISEYVYEEILIKYNQQQPSQVQSQQQQQQIQEEEQKQSSLSQQNNNQNSQKCEKEQNLSKFLSESGISDEKQFLDVYYDFCIKKIKQNAAQEEDLQKLKSISSNQSLIEDLEFIASFLFDIQKTLEIQKFQQLLEFKHFRELSVNCLESFRYGNCSELQEQNFEYICNVVFIQIIRLSYQYQDLQQLRKIILLSFSLYKVIDNSKIYIQEMIKFDLICQKIDLWEGIIFQTMREEQTKFIEQNNKNNNIYNQEKNSNFIQSTLTSLSLQMIKFNLDKQEIRNIIVKFGQSYGLSDLTLQDILSFIKSDGKVNHHNYQTNNNPQMNMLLNKTTNQQINKVVQFNNSNKTDNNNIIISNPSTIRK